MAKTPSLHECAILQFMQSMGRFLHLWSLSYGCFSEQARTGEMLFS